MGLALSTEESYLYQPPGPDFGGLTGVLWATGASVDSRPDTSRKVYSS